MRRARHPHRLALHDVPLEAGPTEVARGSHRLTNHLNAPPGALSRDDLLYQSAREATPLGWNQRPPVCRTGLPSGPPVRRCPNLRAGLLGVA